MIENTSSTGIKFRSLFDVSAAFDRAAISSDFITEDTKLQFELIFE